MSNQRFSPTIRRELILAAAVKVATEPGGWSRLTRQVIAVNAECSEGLVSRYLGDIPSVRKAVMRYAIRHEIVEIVVQSLAAHDGYAIKKWLSAELRQRSIASLLG